MMTFFFFFLVRRGRGRREGGREVGDSQPTEEGGEEIYTATREQRMSATAKTSPPRACACVLSYCMLAVGGRRPPRPSIPA